ncbi:LexA family protein [Litchfieldella xinjiangensis]|uniref:LexA family protein n=1 Tax=Litchfieldella xinjiangensis TaxID=1166948 RepID=UPI000694E6F2|nr:translesion error-prone DNA polymerase V autoproteolytic subunit [Halomonas xinjiangensis]
MSLQLLSQAHPDPTPCWLPYPLVLTRAGLSGFPSPAQDYEERALDLNQHLVRHPAATFFMRVTGDSMEPLGIRAGDLLVIDRSIELRPGHILVASIDGEVVVKRYDLIGKQPFLCSGNPRYAPIPLAECDCQVWGVVRAVVHECLS